LNQINIPEEFTLSAHLHPLSELHGSFEESGVFATLDIILAARAHGDSWMWTKFARCSSLARDRDGRRLKFNLHDVACDKLQIAILILAGRADLYSVVTHGHSVLSAKLRRLRAAVRGIIV
jgi:hypothetical protein